jgi:hypothetical protein
VQTKEEILQVRKVWYEKNKQRLIAKAIKWNQENPERRKEIKTQWAENNKDKVNKSRKQWKDNNQAKIYTDNSIRRANILNATPKWVDKNSLKDIESFYVCSQMFSMYTGQKYHVDHIIPLRGKKVSGLHVPDNLQVIPAKENLAKSNIFSNFSTRE